MSSTVRSLRVLAGDTLRPIWTPADYEETLADAAKHRAIPGAYAEQAALYAEAAEHAGRHRAPEPAPEFGTTAHEALLALGRPPALAEGTRVLWKPHFDEAAVEGVVADVIEFDPEFPTMGRLYVLGWVDHAGRLGRTKITADRVLAVVEDQDDDDRPLPFRRNPNAECPSCWAFPGEACGPFCLSRMTPAEQIAHRDHVIAGTIAELDRIERLPDMPAGAMSPDVPPWADGRHDRDDDPFAVTSCTIAGRHRVRADPFRRVRRLRAVLIVAVLVLVMALAALWASSRAGAETFDVCPSGLSGVATPDTSCAFADSVRAAFYWQPSWTVIARSPVTGKFYTMQCSRTDTTGTGWYDSKRCFGVNDAGAVLVVYVA